ncbi:MAG: hypothetical protein ACYTBS_20890 [Planctomycetota bacterium]
MNKTALFVLVAIALLSPSVTADDPATAGLLSDPALPNGFGVNIHFRGQPRDLDMIAQAGFKLIRMDLTWAMIERGKGIYEFESIGYDSLTEGCSERGIRRADPFVRQPGARPLRTLPKLPPNVMQGEESCGKYGTSRT